MARPKEFDVDTALERALEVFWLRGYEATSMQDLVEAMGIRKASLYGTFGDKRALYLAALKRYQERSLADLRAHLSTAPEPLAALQEFVRANAASACRRSGRRGCFCINANVELAPHDAEIGERLRRHSEQVEAVFAATLQRAKDLGRLRRDADCRGLATFLFGLIAAIQVLGRQRAGRARLDALVAQGLGALAPAASA